MKRPKYGEFGRLELAILGAPCSVIQHYAKKWSALIGDRNNIAYVDADHKAGPDTEQVFSINYTDKIAHQQLAFKQAPNSFQKHALFNKADLVFINGNHFAGSRQIVIIHPEKTLEHKLDKLTDIALILLADGQQIPLYLKESLNNFINIPVLQLTDGQSIATFIEKVIEANIPAIKGLVLAGGESIRMQTDKGGIAYHGKSQRAHAFGLLSDQCPEVFISGKEDEGYPVIEDTFTGLGPFGGILSAMQKDPDAAWLTIACDLPYLTGNTLKYLMEKRNPSKIATAFLDSESKFPEPLITIWEPKAYPVMLQFLSQGYSCPRKVLINSDVELLTAPDTAEFRNVNFPAERDEALRFFGVK